MTKRGREARGWPIAAQLNFSTANQPPPGSQNRHPECQQQRLPSPPPPSSSCLRVLSTRFLITGQITLPPFFTIRFRMVARSIQQVQPDRSRRISIPSSPPCFLPRCSFFASLSVVQDITVQASIIKSSNEARGKKRIEITIVFEFYIPSLTEKERS